MSDQSLARRARINVSVSGIDVSTEMREYMISMTYTDNEADETDDLQIKLEDRDGIWLCKWLDDIVQASATKYVTKSVKVQVAERCGPSSNQYTVRYGSRGSAVWLMQSCLVQLGYRLPYYGVDGKFGWETYRAVCAFQRNYGISVDGICGPITWSYLASACSYTVYKTVEKLQTVKVQGLKMDAVIIAENWSGDGKDSVLFCGQFELDAPEYSGPPNILTIKATSLPYSSQIRQTKKSKSWEGYRLSGIAKEMAEKNEMKLMYESYNDPYYTRVEQANVSDISFLSTLCKRAGASLKATDNMLVIFDQAKYEAKSTVFEIRRKSVSDAVTTSNSYTKFKLSASEADAQYASCNVSYTDPETGKVISGTAYTDDYDASDSNNQSLNIKSKVSSAGEATTLAAKLLRLHNKYGKQASFTVPGNPSLVAGVTVQLTDWGFWSGKYIVAQAKHTVGSSGYTTQVKLRTVLEGY